MSFELEIIDLRLVDHLMFFFLAILLPALGLLSSKGIEDFTFDRETKLSLYYSNGFFLWIAAAVSLTSWNYFQRSFGELGFSQPYWNSIVFILTLLFILLYIVELFSKRIFQRRKKKMDWAKNLQFLPDNFDEFKHYLFLAFAAGICEEILFRGFLIHYIYSIFGGGGLAIIAAIILPAIFFSIGHIYQGSWAIVKIAFGAVILSGIYLTSKSLYIVIAIHIAVDIFSAIFAKILLADKRLQEELEN